MNSSSSPEHAVALIHMPWASVARPSIALGILKECAKRAGYIADVHYFNIIFAETIGFRLFEHIANISPVYPEWFFSVHLFGPSDLRQVANSWQDLQTTANGQRLADELLQLAGGSEENRMKVADAVPGFIDRCLDEIDWKRYKAVGFSVTFAQTMASLLLAKRLKNRFPELKIIFGGANADAEMGFELLRGCEWIDYIVHGEAEQSFPQLLSAIAENRLFAEIPGVSVRHNTALVPGYSDARPLAQMDESPIPDYDDFFREARRCKLEKMLWVSLPVEASRGCWWGIKHHCTFCALNGSIMSFRKKSASRVYEEIVEMSNRYRCLNFNMVDHIIDLGYFNDLLPCLAAADLGLTLFYEVKPHLTREQVRLLAAAGITLIQPGIESFSTDLLLLMRKGTTAIQNIQFLKWCAEFDLKPFWNILYGFPGEDIAFYKDYPRILPLLFHLSPPAGVIPILFERFSPYHFDRDKFNLQIKANFVYALLYPESKIDLDKIAYYFEGMWDGKDKSKHEFIASTKALSAEWRTQQQTGSIGFFYEDGQQLLTLYDSRPLAGEACPTVKRITLDDIQSKIFLFCDEHRSFHAVRQMLLDEVKTPPDEHETKQLLDHFVEQGLMFREGNHYLSLATRRAAQRNQTSGTDALA